MLIFAISRVHEINFLYQNRKDFDGEDTATMDLIYFCVLKMS